MVLPRKTKITCNIVGVGPWPRCGRRFRWFLPASPTPLFGTECSITKLLGRVGRGHVAHMVEMRTLNRIVVRGTSREGTTRVTYRCAQEDRIKVDGQWEMRLWTGFIWLKIGAGFFHRQWYQGPVADCHTLCGPPSQNYLISWIFRHKLHLKYMEMRNVLK